MYKSGQVVFDKSIEEAVIFIEGGGDSSDVVCTGIEDGVAHCKTTDLVPIWDAKDKVLVGVLASKNFATIIKVTKANYKKYYDYIVTIQPQISHDGKDKEQRYHLKQ